MYYIGYKGGKPLVLKYGKKFGITAHEFEKGEKWITKYGDAAIFVSQLLPVVRTYVSLPPGVLKMNYKKFIFFTFTGAYVWCLALAFMAMKLGEHWEDLTEQMKAIQKELRQKDDFAKEVQELFDKIKAAKMSDEARDAAEKECGRLEKMMPYSPEATVVRTYLDWLINLPWQTRTKDTLDISAAEKILDDEHFGLKKAKERILEYLAVQVRAKKLKSPILCLVGPPGVGKTPEAPAAAKRGLAEMGRMTRDEWITAATFLLMVGGWVLRGTERRQ
jgi:hypothetical protein